MIDEISIIIPTLNEEHYLPKLLDSIIAQDFKGDLQVIIVDGKSDDHTLQVASKFHNKLKDLDFIDNNRGIGKQRNAGAKKAKYKYLLFVDADMVLQKSFLSRLVQKIDEKEPFIVSVTLWPADGNLYEWLMVAIAYPLILFISFLKPTTPGGLTFTTKEQHLKIHGYNENTHMGEDIDYGEKAVAKGAKHSIFFTPIAHHSVRRTREMGMLRFLLFWLKNYISIQKNGVINRDKNVQYPYGHYKK